MIERVAFPDTCSMNDKRNFSYFLTWEAYAEELASIHPQVLEHRLGDDSDRVTVREFLTRVPQVGYQAWTSPVRTKDCLDRRGSFMGGHPWTATQYPWPLTKNGAPAAPLVQLRLDTIQHLTPVPLEPVVVQIWSFDEALPQVRAIPTSDVMTLDSSDTYCHVQNEDPHFCGGSERLFALNLDRWVDPKIVLPTGFFVEPNDLDVECKGNLLSRFQHILHHLEEWTSMSDGHAIQLFGLNEGIQDKPDSHYKSGRGLLLNVVDHQDDDEAGIALFKMSQEMSLFATDRKRRVIYSAVIDGE